MIERGTRTRGATTHPLQEAKIGRSYDSATASIESRRTTIRLYARLRNYTLADFPKALETCFGPFPCAGIGAVATAAASAVIVVLRVTVFLLINPT